MKKNSPAKVYFNSACPICEAGISAQKQKMESCPIEWKDIHTDHSSRSDLAADTEFVRKRLHLIDEDGKVHIGIDAFIAIWERSPNEKWKARIAKTPIIHGLSIMAYNGFAYLLYKWNIYKKHW